MTGSEARKEGRKGSCVQAGRQKAECCQLKRLGEKCHWPDLRRTVVTPKAHSGVEHPTRAEELPDFLSRTTTYQGKKGRQSRSRLGRGKHDPSSTFRC